MKGRHKPGLDLEDHLKMGPEFVAAYKTLLHQYVYIANSLPLNHPAVKHMSTVIKRMQLAKSELDTLYHQKADGDVFSKYGHVWYEDRSKEPMSHEEQVKVSHLHMVKAIDKFFDGPKK